MNWRRGEVPAVEHGEGSWPRSVVICGGGNGGHALAVVASQNFEGTLDWLVGSDEKATLLSDNMART